MSAESRCVSPDYFARTLRDFMRVMLSRLGSAKTPYTIDDVVAVASEVAAADMNPFFQRYVIGTEMLPIEEALRRAGFDVYTPLYSGELYIWPNGIDAVWPAWTRQ